MTDMKFTHPLQCCNGLNVDVVERMARVEAHANRPDEIARPANTREFMPNRSAFGITSLLMKSLRVRPCVNLAHAGTDSCGRFYLRCFGVDENAGDDARIGQTSHHLLEACLLGNNVKPALGGDFVSALRHQHGHFRRERGGDAHHLVGGRHLQIELDMREFAKPPDIRILDMPAILAQMHGDAVGTAQMRFDCRPDGVRLIGAASLPNRGNVVDIDTEFDHGESL